MRPLPLPANDTGAPRRTERFASSLFAGASIALFVILAASVVAATVLYYRWR